MLFNILGNFGGRLHGQQASPARPRRKTRENFRNILRIRKFTAIELRYFIEIQRLFIVARFLRCSSATPICQYCQ
jgi:hypothetical protein